MSKLSFKTSLIRILPVFIFIEMKIILSRKGFDSSAGKQASPILPDGTLLSLPIPSFDDNVGFSDLSYEGQSYQSIINSLNPRNKVGAMCHLDPDIRPELRPRDPAWLPAFGQMDAALTSLRNNNVSDGDLFLFFGWFRPTEYDAKGMLKYQKKAPHLHIIYGYMEVGEIITDLKSVPDWLSDHPHTAYTKAWHDGRNALFIATKQLSIAPELPGAGSLTMRNDRVLTKPGYSRRFWSLPDFFKKVKISYHPSPWVNGCFKSVGRGQEFVMDGIPEIIDWARNIIV